MERKLFGSMVLTGALAIGTGLYLSTPNRSREVEAITSSAASERPTAAEGAPHLVGPLVSSRRITAELAGGREPEAPDKQPARRTSASTTLVSEQVASRGRNLDGSEFEEARARFDPELAQQYIEDALYNPLGIKPSAETKAKIESSLKLAQNKVFRVCRKVSKIQTTAIKDAFAHSTFLPLDSDWMRDGKQPKGAPEEVVICSRIGGVHGYTVYGPGTHPERDALLSEACNVMAMTEQQIILWIAEEAARKGLSR